MEDLLGGRDAGAGAVSAAAAAAAAAAGTGAGAAGFSGGAGSEGHHEGEAGSVQMSTADAELDSQMTNFFKVIGAMKRLMRGVDTNVEELARITSTMQREIDSDGSRKQATQIVRNTDEALKTIAERLKKLTERVRSRQRGIAEDRIYEGIVTTLNREFTALMQRYQQAEGEYRERCREEVVRQYRIAHPEASREKLEEIKYSDDNPAVFRSALMEAEKGIAQNRLADIQEKHADIVELSRSIHELHQLFVQMATLVEEQGEMVHNIASNVQKARDYVAKAEVELGKALKSQSSARKKTCCILVIVIVILIIIIAPTISSVLTRA